MLGYKAKTTRRWLNVSLGVAGATAAAGAVWWCGNHWVSEFVGGNFDNAYQLFHAIPEGGFEYWSIYGPARSNLIKFMQDYGVTYGFPSAVGAISYQFPYWFGCSKRPPNLEDVHSDLAQKLDRNHREGAQTDSLAYLSDQLQEVQSSLTQLSERVVADGSSIKQEISHLGETLGNRGSLRVPEFMRNLFEQHSDLHLVEEVVLKQEDTNRPRREGEPLQAYNLELDLESGLRHRNPTRQRNSF